MSLNLATWQWERLIAFARKNRSLLSEPVLFLEEANRRGENKRIIMGFKVEMENVEALLEMGEFEEFA